jgi:hypothetical protein
VHEQHLVAEAILRERHAHWHRHRHHIHHLDEIRPRHPVRARLAVGLVRLARFVEPGAAGAARPAVSTT